MAEVGRPTIVTPEILNKLEEAFALGCTDLEACLYADISKTTLYNYQLKHPEFVERKEELKETPILLARKTVINSLQQPQSAQWFLERKKKDEFSTRIENTGRDGKDLIPQPILGNLNVPSNGLHPNLSDNQDSPALEADQSNSGRDISQQDDINPAATDTPGTER
jgi:hypothetical protein